MSSGFRTSVESEYLGRAMFTFAALEWQVVWCCELISPGFINGVGRITAGQIAHAFEKHVPSLPPSDKAPVMMALAQQFIELVSLRNNIAHATPGTQHGTGAQLLFRHGAQLTAADLDTATHKFEDCSGQLNELFYNYLREDSTRVKSAQGTRSPCWP